MKTSKFNKSEIMTEAWEMFRDYEGEFTFAECLKWSWNIAKGSNSSADQTKKMTVKEIFNSLYMNIEMDTLLNNEILNTVKNNSNGFQSNIATRALDSLRISEKQAWSVAYEYKKVA